MNRANNGTIVVTIDGPAGAGKSSAARALSSRLGFEFLDTGAMFRAVALAGLRAGLALEDQQGLARLLEQIRVEIHQGQIWLDGENVSTQIRTPEVSAGSSVVAAGSAVRTRLAALQRAVASGRSMVCEGRDQGTVVFPDALCKFFLTAEPEARLQRRFRELQGKGETIDLEALRRAQAERDLRDTTRELAPLKAAADAVVVDSTRLALAEVIERMEVEVRRRLVNGT